MDREAAQELGTLVGGGDCLDHYHNSDRFPPRDTMLWLHSLERVKTITTTYTITSDDDIIVVNGTTLAVTLPPARNGRHLRFTTVSGSATLTPYGSETINGSASHTIDSSHKTCHLKAISGGWIEI